MGGSNDELRVTAARRDLRAPRPDRPGRAAGGHSGIQQRRHHRPGGRGRGERARRALRGHSGGGRGRRRRLDGRLHPRGRASSRDPASRRPGRGRHLPWLARQGIGAADGLCRRRTAATPAPSPSSMPTSVRSPPSGSSVCWARSFTAATALWPPFTGASSSMGRSPTTSSTTCCAAFTGSGSGSRSAASSASPGPRPDAAAEPVWESDVARFGVDVWLTVQALERGVSRLPDPPRGQGPRRP